MVELVSIANNKALITIRYATNTPPTEEAQPTAIPEKSSNMLTGMTTAIQNIGPVGKSATFITLIAGILVVCVIFFRKRHK